ncbi:hypothetical protein [uncultured Tessaracoccus sp.]|uniref:hypothetical protein n=1 Tax=uncultured Tessaracoccus sp. TaxID=905023 RepID=UPI0025D36382|nr:hypothetical protein [uncultured Tessaracoccus sp.]
MRSDRCIIALVLHGLCFLAANYGMLVVAMLGWAVGETPSILFVLLGLAYWLGGGLLVWQLWGGSVRRVLPVFAGTLGMLFLVSFNLAFGSTFPGTNLVAHDVVHCLLVSTLPITASWLAVGGRRWRTVVVHAAAFLTVVAGIIVRFTLPGYDSVARFLFRW